MAGCFGNSPEDRYMERQLDKWLDSQESPDPVDVTLQQDTDDSYMVECPCGHLSAVEDEHGALEDCVTLAREGDLAPLQNLCDELECSYCGQPLEIARLEKSLLGG